MPRWLTTFATTTALGIAVAVTAPPALASDGVTEINAARAAAGDVTPGDAPGLPVTLSVPGSYRLTSNLVQPDAATKVLLVTANNVTIDLGGFEISGPFTCPGTPANCAAAGLGYAVDGTLVTGTTVRNGTVHGTARALALGDRCVVRDVIIDETTNFGVFGGEHCSVSGVVATRNGSVGIQLDSGSVTNSAAGGNEGTGIFFSGQGTVTGSSANDNGGNGIGGNAGTQVSDCSVADNVGSGILLNVAGVVTSSSAYNNGQDGIRVAAGGLVRHSAAYSNGGDGIEAANGAQAFANAARSNTGFGLRLGDDAGYRENVLTANNGGLEVQVGTVLPTDTPLNLGSNLCGTDAICP
jgi:hypothetical protein